MYLKKIDIIGFKSFAEKTALDFNSGVTAIVGPNGCGKSNVSDAIKWVLGEQSAKSLRGLKMEDVIFNGTSTREPVNFAEVSLTLNNSDRALPIDYEDVVITRRLYRTGESEYLLNKSGVRLKDIQSMLAGTGLGVGNYSFIEQGKIDRILNAKPEDRRALFEEASGITRYKVKKKEALRNLEATEQNLQRITDIIAEQGRQIASLERQAKKAQKFKEDFERLKKYDIRVALKERLGHQDKETQIREKANAARNALDQNSQALGNLKMDVAQSRDALKKVEQEFSEAKAQHMIVENQIKNNTEKMAIFSKYVDEITEKIESIKTNLIQSNERLSILANDEDQLRQQKEDIARESEIGENAYKAAEKDYDEFAQMLKAKSVRVENTEKDILKITEDSSKLQQTRVKLESVIQNDQRRAQTLQFEQEQFTQEIESIGQKSDEVQTQLGNIQVEIRNKIHEREKIEGALQQIQQDFKTNEIQLKSVSQECSSRQSRLEVLQDIAKRHEGFSQSTRFVLEQSRLAESSLQGVQGALADLVEVDRGYELALEQALEDMSQAIVCENDQVIQRAMHMLKNAHKGRVVFISMDALVLREPSSTTQVPHGLSRLSDHARPHPKIAKVFESLLHDVCVVNSIEQAHQWKEQYPHITFVSMDGDLVHGPKTISGQSDQSEEAMLFGRDSRINELKGLLVELNLERDRLQIKSQELSDREKLLNDSLKQYMELIPSLQVRMADLKSRKEHVEEDLSKSTLKFNQNLHEFNQIQSAIATQEHEIHEIRVAQSLLQAEKQERIRILNEVKQWIAEHKGEKDKRLVEITRLKSQWESVHDRLNQMQQNYDRHHSARLAEEEAVQHKSKEKEDLQTRLQETRSQLESLTENSARQMTEREKLLEQHNLMTEKRQHSMQSVNQLESKLSSAESLASESRESLHQFEMDLEKMHHELQRVKERIQTNYSIDLDDESAVKELQIDDSTPLEEPEAMEKIREKLSKLGNVNLIAVEEYDDLKERFEFLNREKEDLLRAKDDIHKALLKINRTTRELFIDTFTKIQTYFVEYYKLLFGGGTAEIILMDESDILESGIEIVARPPGKKLQSISLLSGGEKALTAIALMFAVFKVKPSPFCILDEIDAPLDDVNVQRFANALREFIKESQFIIITHNKRTMSVADTLYGITMQKTGMSNVVSVKFDEDSDRDTNARGRSVQVAV